MKKKYCGIILILTLLLLLCSCGEKKSKYTDYSFDYFDTVITVVGYEETQEEFDAVAEEIFSGLKYYHKLYSIYHSFEDIQNLRTINSLTDGKHETVTVEKPIIDMLSFSEKMHKLTNGYVNIAMGSVLSLWHNYREVGKDTPESASLPPVERLRDAAQHTDISNMVIDEENSTVTLTDSLMSLDVGAIAKGYATEAVARELESKGISGYLLNVGGNVRTIGTRPDGKPWTVGIESPEGEGLSDTVELYGGMSVVTSGSYQRYYLVDGKAYHHIIHPDTLMPARGFKAVSVICKDSGLGDALSTALFCMTSEDGISLVNSIPDAEALWIYEDGTRLTSSGWKEYVK